MIQSNMPWVGPSSPTRYNHPPQEVRICRSLSDAVYVSMRYAQMTQETLAGRIHVSPAYMSMLLSGKRPWQDKHLTGVRKATGSLATLQYAAMLEGVELYVDEVAVREAQAHAVLRECQEARRAA